MKNLIWGFVVLSLSANVVAATCDQQEAQFIGEVKEARRHKADNDIYHCYFKIDFHRYNPSGVCPLDIDIAASAELTDDSCSLQNGQFISGILVLRDNTVFID